MWTSPTKPKRPEMPERSVTEGSTSSRRKLPVIDEGRPDSPFERRPVQFVLHDAIRSQPIVRIPPTAGVVIGRPRSKESIRSHKSTPSMESLGSSPTNAKSVPHLCETPEHLGVLHHLTARMAAMECDIRAIKEKIGL